MPPATRRKCQVPGWSFGDDGGPYFTLEGLSSQESVLKDIELHITMAHSSMNIVRSGRERDIEIRPDKFPRPEISDPATDTDWQYFVASWEAYKRATRLPGQEACDQLWHCPTASLKKSL